MNGQRTPQPGWTRTAGWSAAGAVLSLLVAAPALQRAERERNRDTFGKYVPVEAAKRLTRKSRTSRSGVSGKH